jgi:hypothetical protein
VFIWLIGGTGIDSVREICDVFRGDFVRKFKLLKAAHKGSSEYVDRR